MIKKIDYDNDAHVNFQEFLVLMVKMLAKADSQEEELVQVFKRFTGENNDEIDSTNLLRMF